MTDLNISDGVRTVIARMESHPEEFFGDTPKWRFIFRDTFREGMTETEKGMIHAALQEVRRKEFNYTVLKTLLDDERETQIGRLVGGTVATISPYTTLTAADYNELFKKQMQPSKDKTE